MTLWIHIGFPLLSAVFGYAAAVLRADLIKARRELLEAKESLEAARRAAAEIGKAMK